MAKFISLLILVIGIVSVLSLGKYSKLPIDNSKFDFDAHKQKFEQHKTTLHELEAAKHIKHVVTEVVKKKVFVVSLDTPELVRGHKLFGKCISCHGKMAEGKKSQKAPKLAGQMIWYIKSSLKKMQSKERINKVMDVYIKKLSDDDFSALATYINKLPWSN